MRKTGLLIALSLFAAPVVACKSSSSHGVGKTTHYDARTSPQAMAYKERTEGAVARTDLRPVDRQKATSGVSSERFRSLWNQLDEVRAKLSQNEQLRDRYDDKVEGIANDLAKAQRDATEDRSLDQGDVERLDKALAEIQNDLSKIEVEVGA